MVLKTSPTQLKNTKAAPAVIKTAVKKAVAPTGIVKPSDSKQNAPTGTVKPSNSKQKDTLYAMQDKMKVVDQSMKVWIGGLAETTSGKAVKAHFTDLGCAVGLVDIMKNGTACVSLESADDATTAIDVANGTELDGNTLEVDVWTKPSRPASPKGKGKGKGYGKGYGKGKWMNTGGLGGLGSELGAILELLGVGGGGGGSAWGKGAWGKGGGKGSWQNTFKVDKSGGELGEFTGTIKSFNFRTNYGFIACPELDEDVFLHGDMKKGFREGQTVKFTAVLNKDGKTVGIDLKSGLK